jgi:hypothetical protein
MTLNRRAFFLLISPRPMETVSIPVAVLETFTRDQTPSAILVHHSENANRDKFADWLRTNPKAYVRVRDRSGTEADGVIFRVRMCFGRGLIVLDGRLQVREGDVLTLVDYKR